ncbi:MAG: hypothetical protein NT105_02545 [Verrucomicrobia bacterium]|nr:hypothetical protein [Verrucomicrobiota bacterium]
MKELLVGLLLGLVAGGAATWLMLQSHKSAAPAAAEAEIKHAEAPKSDGRIHLNKEQLANAGLAFAQPQPVEWQPSVKAFGRVLDASPLATLLTEIEAARAAMDASTKEYERLKKLNAQDANASVRAVEAADATLRRDRAALEASQMRLLAGWGKALAGRVDLAALARSLVAQESALIRVDFLAGQTLPPESRRVRVAPLPGDEVPRDTVVIGSAPTADAQAQGAALLVLLRAPTPAPGAALLAWVSGSGAAQHGLRLPRSAIVRHEGQAFVFVAVGVDAFARRRVEIAPPQADGVIVMSGVKVDERVVVTGAQQLLSEELKTAGGPE